MELSCEVRGPLWVPRKVRARPFKRTSPEAEPTWLEPESAAAKGPSGRGISESVPGGRSRERERRDWGPVQRQELEGALSPNLPSCPNPSCHSLTPPPHILHFFASRPDHPLEIIEASPPPPPPPFYPESTLFPLQSFPRLVACGFPHSDRWFGVALGMVSILAFSTIPGLVPLHGLIL